MTVRRAVLGLILLLVTGGIVVAWQVGPRNILGLIFYDQRHEGTLRVGDMAPDVELATLDGGSAHLAQYFGGRPLVLVFGSFT
jgi:hypothetical protein